MKKDIGELRKESKKQANYLFDICIKNKSVSVFLLLFINGMLNGQAKNMIIKEMEKCDVGKSEIDFFKMLCYHNSIGTNCGKEISEMKEKMGNA